MNGIDISSYQANIDLTKISNDIKYVYIKATEGCDYIDPQFKNLFNKVKSTNKKYGFYHFMSEKTDPCEQAKDFYNTIKDTGYSLIPVLDIENNNKGRTKAQVTDRVLAFLNKFKELSGIDCIIYTYSSFEKAYLDSRVANYKCWIANYNGGASYPAPIIFKKYIGHQYSGSAKINGYSGQIDVNNFTSEIEMSNHNTHNTNSVQNNTSVKISVNLRDWQSAYNSTYKKNILVDGIMGNQTKEALNKTCIKKGHKNALVGWLQIRIGTSVDNIFGPKTEQALRDYQRRNKLSVDGIAGVATFTKLLSQFNN